MNVGSCSTREVHPLDGLFNKLINFNSFVRMPTVGFENEIISMLMKIDARRGHDGKASGAKKKPNTSSHFNRELRKWEFLVKYNKSPLLAGSRGKSIGDQTFVQ